MRCFRLQIKALNRWFAATVVAAVCLQASAQGQTTELGYGLTPVYGNPSAPPMELPDLNGKQHRLFDYRGSVVLINFWATWCPPCIHELPTLQKLKEELRGERFEILAVNLGEDADTIRAFQQEFDIEMGFPVLLAREESILDQWKIQGLPMSYIIDRHGQQAYEALGPRDFADAHIVVRLRKLMKK